MTTLFSLSEQIRRCTACPLWKMRTLTVSGEGSINTKIMFVTEAPNEEEDRQGLFFVGKSGEFLNELLKFSNLNRESVFITGVVKCHPPKDRIPFVKELKACRELWLNKQIELIQPKLIVILGKSALKSLLNKTNLDELNGKIIINENQKYLITYHPVDGINNPKLIKKIETAFVKLKKFVFN